MDFLKNLLKLFFKIEKKEDTKKEEPKEEPKKEEVVVTSSEDYYLPDDVRELIFKVTSAFEGAKLGTVNYENITGNFDGQGLSIGFLQWCTGQGSDYYLFKPMLDRYPKQLEEAMGPLYPEFSSMIDWAKKDRLKWAISINTPNNSIQKKWKDALLNLCRTKEFQQIQREAAEHQVQKAAAYCDKYGLKSVRALALLFDICTQNGSIRDSVEALILQEMKKKPSEVDLLRFIAIKRAEASHPLWIEDVKARKLCIVNGKGVVHKTKYDLDSFGLSDAPFRRKK